MKLLAVPLALAALAAATAACSGGADATHGPSVSPDTGDDGGSGASCASRAGTASSAVSAAVQAASSSCMTDDDCTQIVASTECATLCPMVTSLAGAKTIAAAVATANAGSCSNFTADGCTATAPMTCPTLAGAACVTGRCQAASPATWQSITLKGRIPSAQMVSNPDAPCQANETCTSWTITPDGTVVQEVSSADSVDATTATLSADDLMTVDTLFTVTPAPESSLTCGSVPAGTTFAYQLAVTRGSSTSYLDVTGCVLTGPPLNVAAQLYTLIKPY
jgi:hypothetical protein